MKKLFCSTLSGIFFTAIAGTLSHFLYEWSNENFLVGFIVPVSESTWEHMKMLFFPMLVYGIFENNILKKRIPSLFCGTAAALLLGTFSIPVLFYTYTGILGTNYLALDIAVFYISILIAFAFRYQIIKKGISKIHCRWLSASILLILICFLVFTLNPPAIGLFQVPFSS